MIGVLAVLGLLAAVVGVLQLASGNANWFRFYAATQYGFATGFQANRNAEADVLLIAAMAFAAWVAIEDRIWRSRQVQLLSIAMLLFFALSVVLTGSRAGVALIAVAIIASAAMIVRKGVFKNWRMSLAAGLALVALGGSAYDAEGKRIALRSEDVSRTQGAEGGIDKNGWIYQSTHGREASISNSMSETLAFKIWYPDDSTLRIQGRGDVDGSSADVDLVSRIRDIAIPME